MADEGFMLPYNEFAAVYDALMRDIDRPKWTEYMLDLLGKERLRVVDCACGTGEISIGLAQAGHIVTGVDVSEAMLAIAAEKARKAGANIPFVRQDMRALLLHRRVDAIISACDGVNYLDSIQAMKEFFRVAHKALLPGGMLLFDISSRYKLQSVLGNNVFTLDEEDVSYIWRNTYDAKTGRIRMDLTVFAREGVLFRRFREEHIQRAFSRQEVELALAESGFEDIRVYAAFTQKAPAETAQRLQFMAVKGNET